MRPITVCAASSGESEDVEKEFTDQDEWSTRRFWGVVTNREKEHSLCCTNPGFLKRKEMLDLPGIFFVFAC
jgi:hypothetical protein